MGEQLRVDQFPPACSGEWRMNGQSQGTGGAQGSSEKATGVPGLEGKMKKTGSGLAEVTSLVFRTESEIKV